MSDASQTTARRSGGVNLDADKTPFGTPTFAHYEQPTKGPGLGVKYDGEKDPFHLVPWDAVRAIAVILGIGAKKYAPRNWELGMDWSRVWRAAINHLTAWWQGEDLDPETGKSHLWHAGCCIVFLIAYERRGVGRDDRPGASDG